MNNNLTKILIGVAIVLIFGISAFGVYRYFSTGPAVSTTEVKPRKSVPFPQSPEINDRREVDQRRVVSRSTSDITRGESLGGEDNGVFSIKNITKQPVSGFYFVEKQDPETKKSKLYLRYTERESGHIYEIAYNENIPKKLSNTTITRVYESYYNNAGDNIIYRRLDDDNNIQNIYSKLETPTISTSTEDVLTNNIGKLNQSLLQFNIKELSVSPNKDKVFYLIAVGDNCTGTIEGFGGKSTGKKQVFSSPISEWLIDWPKENTLFFNTKPSADIPGYLYSVNVDKQDFTKVLGDINGLTSKASPDIKKIVYSESKNGWVDTYLYDLGKKESLTFPFKTLPEKCLWGGVEKNILYCAIPETPSNNKYPDSWYQGVEIFNDEIWAIDTSTGQTKVLANKETLSQTGGIDAINLQLSPKEDYLALINKKDLSLWLLGLK